MSPPPPHHPFWMGHLHEMVQQELRNGAPTLRSILEHAPQSACAMPCCVQCCYLKIRLFVIKYFEFSSLQIWQATPHLVNRLFSAL